MMFTPFVFIARQSPTFRCRSQSRNSGVYCLPKKKDYSSYSKEELIKHIHALEKRKKYGLVWDEERTKEKFEDEAKGKLPVLVEDKKREIKSKDSEKPTHILIEGDNYHALSVLNYTHSKSIDVIYIDPPYNTGNKDFRYNDSYVDKEDSYRHSKWLSFMNNRLKLARRLLTNRGVIFISIDDNELPQLRLLCNEIFQENNVEIYIWQVKDETEGAMPKTAKYTVRKEHEYIVACFNSKQQIKFNKYPDNKYASIDSEWSNPDNDPRGPWMSGNFSRGAGKAGSKYFTITSPSGNTYSRNWAVSEDEYKELNEDNRIYFSKNGKGVPRIKIFKNETKLSIQSSIFSNLKSSLTGKKELTEIIDTNLIDHPKPTELVKRIITIGAKQNSIVLDFFAGSGTTLHSVAKLNLEDGGNRQCILVTNNEGNICTEVCYPRVKKVIEGYKSTGRKEVVSVEGLGGNLKYYKTNFVGSEPTHRNKKLLTDKSIEMLCIRENTFDEVLSKKDISIFKSEKKYTAILFNEIKIEEFKRKINKLKLPVSVYVFSLEGDDFREDFEDLQNEITLCSIPEAILKVYRRIYETAKPRK